MRGTMTLWAPERMLRPMQSTSSWTGSVDDHLRGLAEAGVDDLHAGVAEGAGDDFGAAVVAVESGLGDEDADWVMFVP